MMQVQDRDDRRYLLALSGVMLLGVLAALVFAWGVGRSAQVLLLDQEKVAVSALLAANVPETVVAQAFGSQASISAEAETLLAKLGHDSGTAPWLFADVRGEMLALGGTALVMMLLLGVLVMMVALLHLRRQEKRFLAASETIAAYTAGNFSARLLKNENGALAQLFGAVEELALSLEAKSENEQRVKEFLKSMISDISHQVKTPLAALRMYNEIIAGEPENPETVRTFAEKSERALDKLEQLIHSLLRLTRLDAGSIIFSRKPERLSTVVAQALENLTTRALHEGKTIACSGDEGVRLCCDAAWTAEAVSNLVKNALDHTSPGGHIQISWEQGPALLRLSVADDGEGIAADDIHHIFKRFYRSPHAASDSPGVGLGLPIAKAIVEGQGGTLAVTSSSGEGTVFTMAFPSK